MADLTAEDVERAIRRQNVRMAWRIQLAFTSEQRLRLERLCRKEFGKNWREIVEATP